MLLLYRMSVWLYALIVRVIAPFHRRAGQFISQRKGIFERLELDFRNHEGKLIWVHCASLGEYEQAKPILDLLQERRPLVKVLLTFFSPSGLLGFKDQELVDYLHYLPLDARGNASRFLETVRPNLAIFIKYELWYYYLMALNARNIPLLLVSGIFRRSQIFFHPMGKFYLTALSTVNHFFLQDDYSAALLRSRSIRAYTVAGDTRFDRVLEVANAAGEAPLVEAFRGNEKLIVMGSVWPSDMKYLLPIVEANHDRFKFIIAPHQVGDLRIYEKIHASAKYSELNKGSASTLRVLIIDNYGMLSKLYRYADYAIVGGAFRGALHNVLEPAVYGIPVFFGADASNEKFIEAIELVKHGGGFTYENSDHLQSKLDEMTKDADLYQEVCRLSRAYVTARTGASGQVMKKIEELI